MGAGAGGGGAIAGAGAVEIDDELVVFSAMVVFTAVISTSLRSMTSPLTFKATTAILWLPGGTLAIVAVLVSEPFSVAFRLLSS